MNKMEHYFFSCIRLRDLKKLKVSETFLIHLLKSMDLTKSFFNGLIAILLCGNLIYLTVYYMKYKAITDVAPVFPVKLDIQKVSLCFSLPSLLGNYNERSEKFSINNTLPSYFNMTFNEMFNKTPRAVDTLNSCKYRDFISNVMISENNGTRCAQLFKITKFKMQGYMCYRYEWIESHQYSYHALVNSLYEPRELYSLSLNSPLSDEYTFYPVLHYDELPDDDRIFNKEGHKILPQAMFILSINLYETRSLKAPYETRCVELSKVSCYQECVDKIYKKYGYIHDASLVIENSSDVNYKPVEIGQYISNFSVRVYCHKKCTHPSCIYKLVVTQSSRAYPSNNNLTFVIETVNKPPIKIAFFPQFNLNDFLTQMASLVGIYIAFSFVTLRKLFKTNDNIISVYSLDLKMKLYSSVLSKIFSSNVKVYPLGKNPNIDSIKMKNDNFKIKLNRLSKFLSYILKFLILICFSWQCINVQMNYFSYKTTVKFQYMLNPLVDLPALTLCSPLEDFTGIKQVSEVDESTYPKRFIKRDLSINLTLEQLFDKTNIKKIIRGCYMRNWDEIFKSISRHNPDDCFEQFKIEKFYAYEKICLIIVPKIRDQEYFQSEIKFSPTNPGILYGIIVSDKFFKSSVSVTTHFSYNISYDLSEFFVTAHKSKTINLFVIANREYKIKLLESPYDTSCSKKESDEQCFQNCQSKLLSKLKRIGHTGIVKKGLPIKILSHTDLMNETFNQELLKIEKNCQKKCWHESCEYSLAITFMIDKLKLDTLDKSEMVFITSLPVTAKTEINAFAMYTFYDFVYQLLCCCSFWLGISFLDLNPFILFGKKTKDGREYLIEKFFALTWLVNKLLTHFNSVNLSKRKPKEMIYDIFIYSIAIVCFSAHAIQSINGYFMYPTFIDIYLDFEKQTNLDLYLCLDTSELMSHRKNISLDSIESKSKLLNRPIPLFFKDTPKESEIIKECSHWGTDARQGKLSTMSQASDRVLFKCKNETICQQLYRVNKFILQNYMCYGIRPRNYTGWDKLQLKSTLHNQKTLFKISIEDSLLTRRFTVMVGRQSIVPLTSSNFAPTGIKDDKFDGYDVTYTKYNQSVLKVPFSHDGFVPFLFDRCLNQCLNKKMLKYKLTFSKRIFKPLNLTFITYSHRKVDLAGSFINEEIDNCENKCSSFNKFVSKDLNNYIGVIVPSLRPGKVKTSNSSKLISFHLKSTSHPILKIIFRLKISLFEQIINIGSIIGIWFGLAMIDLTKFRNTRSKDVSQKEIINFEDKIKLLKQIYNIRYNYYEPGKGKYF